MENKGETHGEQRGNTWSPQGKHREYTGKTHGAHRERVIQNSSYPHPFWIILSNFRFFASWHVKHALRHVIHALWHVKHALWHLNLLYDMYFMLSDI